MIRDGRGRDADGMVMLAMVSARLCRPNRGVGRVLMHAASAC